MCSRSCTWEQWVHNSEAHQSRPYSFPGANYHRADWAYLAKLFKRDRPIAIFVSLSNRSVSDAAKLQSGRQDYRNRHASHTTQGLTPELEVLPLSHGHWESMDTEHGSLTDRVCFICFLRDTDYDPSHQSDWVSSDRQGDRVSSDWQGHRVSSDRQSDRVSSDQQSDRGSSDRQIFCACRAVLTFSQQKSRFNF